MATARRPPSRCSASRRWSTGASGVVRAPSSVPITPVGMPARSRIDPTNAVTVVLPLVPVTPTMVNERDGWPLRVEAAAAIAGRTAPGRTRTWVAPRSRNRSHRSAVAPPLHRLGRIVVAVEMGAADAAEQGARPYLAAVELDGAHLGGGRIAAHTDHVDVVDQFGHLHGGVFQGSGSTVPVGWLRSGPTYGPSVVAPAGTEMLPVPPTAEFEADAVAVAVVGTP